jgi:hypothetical protein
MAPMTDRTAAHCSVERMGLSLENNLFLDNDAGRRGVVYLNNSSSTLPRSVSLVGNSFYRNRLTDQDYTGFARTMYLRAPNDASGWEWHIAGNLIDPDPEPLSDSAAIAL